MVQMKGIGIEVEKAIDFDSLYERRLRITLNGICFREFEPVATYEIFRVFSVNDGRQNECPHSQYFQIYSRIATSSIQIPFKRGLRHRSPI